MAVFCGLKFELGTGLGQISVDFEREGFETVSNF